MTQFPRELNKKSVFASLSLRLLAVSLLFHPLIAFSAPQTISYSDSYGPVPTSWAHNLSIPKFDPNLGQLISMRVVADASINGSIRVESFSAGTGPMNFFAELGSTTTVYWPNQLQMIALAPIYTQNLQLYPYDGVFDYAGPSGNTVTGISEHQAYDSGEIFSPGSMFLGQGQLVFPVTAGGHSIHNGGGNLQVIFTNYATASLQVTYTYEPLVIDSSCQGRFGSPVTSQLSCDSQGTAQSIDVPILQGLPDASYSWTSDCPGVSFSDASQPSTLIAFDSHDFHGAATSCQATLTLRSRYLDQSCAVPVNLSGCQVDCMGVVNGPATKDLCGVCNGNNSCLACVSISITGSSVELDGLAHEQEALVRQAVKYFKAAKGKGGIAKKTLHSAEALRIRQWELAWSPGQTVTTCSNTALCTQSSSSPIAGKFTENSNKFADLVRGLLKKLPKGSASAKARKQITKILNKMGILHTRSLTIVQQIPAPSVCVPQ